MGFANLQGLGAPAPTVPADEPPVGEPPVEDAPAPAPREFQASVSHGENLTTFATFDNEAAAYEWAITFAHECGGGTVGGIVEL